MIMFHIRKVIWSPVGWNVAQRWVGIQPKTVGDLTTGWVWRDGTSADWFVDGAEVSGRNRDIRPSVAEPWCVSVNRAGEPAISVCRLNLGYICQSG